MSFFEDMERDALPGEREEELLQEIYALEDDCEEYALRIEELEKEALSFRKLKEENEVLRKEIVASYKYNDTINKWWKFKLERLQLTKNHELTLSDDKPWVHYDRPNK